MSKHKKSSRAKSPSDKSPTGKKRNGHDKKELKETTAAEAVVSPRKAEPAPEPAVARAKPAESASETVGVRRRAEPAPAAKPAAKAPSKPAPQSAKPAAAAAAKPSAAAQVAPPQAFARAADTFERSFEQARQVTLAVNCKLIDFARANLNSSLEHVRDLAAARSPVRVMRLQMEFWHGCLETFASQARELRVLSAELVERANAPIREHMRGTPRA